MVSAARALERPPLVRLVTELAAERGGGRAAVGGAAADGSLAERLADWLGWADAIALAAALAAGDDPAPAAVSPAAAERCTQARQALVAGLDEGAGFELTPDTEPADLRRHVLARQRAMEAAVARLRAQVRATLGGRSPRLRRLARLDAALEGALTGRERVALALLPSLLERRWKQQRAAADADARTRLAGELRAALRAELDLRLQPVDALIDALREDAR